MTLALDVAAILLVAVAAAHSYLGERYILIRLFRRDNLPRLFGGTEFTIRTLRFAWHLTSVAWLGFAALLFSVAHTPSNPAVIPAVVAATFLIHGGVTLVASRGRHLAWIVFLIVGALSWYVAATLG